MGCIAVSKFQGQLGNLGQLGGVALIPRHVGDVEKLCEAFKTGGVQSMGGDGRHDVLIPYKPEELDKRSGKVTQHLQEQQRIDLAEIDLIVGGFPCQDLSILNRNRKGLNGPKSGLFYRQLEIMKQVRQVREQQGKETFFLVENVESMENKERNKISKELGVEGYMVRRT